MRLGLVVTMYDEDACVAENVSRWDRYFDRIVVVQSQLEPYPAVQRALDGHPNAEYVLLPNLDTRPDDVRRSNSEPFDFIVRSMCRNYSEGFRRCDPEQLDYVVGIMGDTEFFHLWGLWQIIRRMGNAKVACSRPIGQVIHSADLTWEQMADPNHPKGGRPVDDTNRDFMPQLFVVTADLITRMSNIQVTNRWAGEQCIGDAVGDVPIYAFYETAYGFCDGVIYNTPSPMGRVHN